MTEYIAAYIKELNEFTYEDFELTGYDPWPHIAGQVSV